MIWAVHRGLDFGSSTSSVRTRDEVIDFRYGQVTAAGETSSGQYRFTIHKLLDGRVQLCEESEWACELRAARGASVIGAVRPDPGPMAAPGTA